MNDQPAIPADRTALFNIWAPDDCPWSPWVKPVPFAFWPRPLKSNPSVLSPDLRAESLPAPTQRQALLFDLPGGESVRAGALAATLGYRPVPIFSSCPIDSCPIDRNVSGLLHTAVDVEDIITALAQTAHAVATVRLPAEAPPAFLIDSRRRAPGMFINAGAFDNRSAVFPSDFPSVATLRKHGIEGLTVIRDNRVARSPDLVHALNPWRRAGLPIQVRQLTGETVELDWPVRGVFRTLLYRAWLALTLKPNAHGGYGAFVPESSGG